MQFTFVKNIFSKKNRFEVADIHGQPAFEVSKDKSGVSKSRYTLWSNKTNENIEIKYTYKSWKSRCYFKREGKEIAVLTQKMKWFKSYFLLELTDSTLYKIETDTWRKNYHFYLEDELVAHLKCQAFKFKRTYEMTFFQIEHESLLLASVVGLDHLYDMNSSGG